MILVIIVIGIISIIMMTSMTSERYLICKRPEGEKLDKKAEGNLR